MDEKTRRQIDEKGRTALHYAASADYDCVRFFVHEGGVATQGDSNYVTPIHMAASYGRKRSIDWMMDTIDNKSHAVNATDKNNRVPLHFAVRLSRTRLLYSSPIALIKLVLRISLQACAGHTGAVEALLAHAVVNINAVDDKGYVNVNYQ